MWIQDSDPHYNLCGSTLLLLSRIIVEKFVLLLQGWTRTRSYGLPPSSTLSTISPNGGTISRLSYSQVSHHQARNYIPDIRKGRISSQMRSRPFIFEGHRQLDILLQEICLYALVQVGIFKNILFQVINKTGFRFSEQPYTVPVPIWRN